MPRDLAPARCRIVLTGPDTGPDMAWSEYTVADDDLFEQAKRLDETTPNFNASSRAFWATSFGNVKSFEGIS